ncbi:hypothetical protein [Calderihabitans maritimus]|uniref:Ribosome biogenesis GTPase RsgA 1 n=1 Tax=Calderihabitans maritimus TaxID=1246530 RepID=A0A1Z5HXJ0_9FIRM|nr:hypothetical protein [Calderihabitans maritimus]GAW94249.1 Putative ribosome biogenesis GTPase RsgA 1 [Calderihabitans maritimus]
MAIYGHFRDYFRYIPIDCSALANLPDRDFYRLTALEIIKGLAKFPEIDRVLNIPLPESKESFGSFLEGLEEVVRNNCNPVLIVMQNSHQLADGRLENLTALFHPGRFPSGCSPRIGLVFQEADV